MVKRSLSGLVGIPLLVAVVFLPRYPMMPRGLPFAIAVSILAVIGMHEYCRGVRRMGARPMEWLAQAATVLFIITAFQNGPSGESRQIQPALTLLIILGLVAELPRKDRAPVRNLGATALGVVYIGWLFSFLVLLRLVEGRVYVSGRVLDLGSCLAIYAIMVGWACDTGGYFIGTAMGKRKLAPVLSPGKTIEGSIGGVLSAVVLAIGLGAVFDFGLVHSLILGVVISGVSQIGDLCKSSIKREIGIKDFGALLPGHGGILDRFDSLLFASPALFYYYMWFMAH